MSIINFLLAFCGELFFSFPTDDDRHTTVIFTYLLNDLDLSVAFLSATKHTPQNVTDDN